MQSTGEVIGIHEDPRVAMAKALLGAALVPAAAGRRTAPLALLSIADRDKARLPRPGERAGRRPATGSRRRRAPRAALRGGRATRRGRVAKLGEARRGSGEAADPRR